jgi:hypothetical protein
MPIDTIAVSVISLADGTMDAELVEVRGRMLLRRLSVATPKLTRR